jgi:tetratricopeptide (TPR) repeat protein
VLEIAGDDPMTGAGVVIGNPVAWALQGKGLVRKEHGDLEGAQELFDKSLEIATEAGDPETESWVRGMQAMLRSTRGDIEGGVAMGRLNCELTERLGDVFSRSLALANLCHTELVAGDYDAALTSIEEAERLYRSAMDTGGEMEAWRGALHAAALLGVGRVEEAIETASRAAETARRRGLFWGLPLALRALGRALAEKGDPEAAREALSDAAGVAEQTGAVITLAEIREDIDSLPAGAGAA